MWYLNHPWAPPTLFPNTPTYLTVSFGWAEGNVKLNVPIHKSSTIHCLIVRWSYLLLILVCSINLDQMQQCNILQEYFLPDVFRLCEITRWSMPLNYFPKCKYRITITNVTVALKGRVTTKQSVEKCCSANVKRALSIVTSLLAVTDCRYKTIINFTRLWRRGGNNDVINFTN